MMRTLVNSKPSHRVGGEGRQHAVTSEFGDVEAALAAAATRVQATYAYATADLAQVPLKVRAAVTEEREDGRLIVWTGTNVPFGVRARLSRTLGISEAATRVIVPSIGGGFGGKNGGEGIEVACLARVAGRPVIDVRAGLDATDSVIAWDFREVNGGASGFAFPYAVPNRRLRYQPGAYPPGQGPYRALSSAINTFACESHIDMLAYVAGADPLRFRLRHLDDERFAAVLETAAGRFGWCPSWHLVSRPVRRDSRWLWRGAGLAIGLERGGRVAVCAEVLVDGAGQVQVTRIVAACECGALDLPSAGSGDAPLIAVAPAIANAIFAATRQRLRSLPLLPAGKLPQAVEQNVVDDR
jgi:isoquinoline 1-oxidoreductase